MPQIDLGKLRFDWKGTWDNSATYELNDVVQYVVSGAANVYVALGSVSANTLPTDTNFWALMLAGIDSANYDTSSEVDAKIAAIVDTAPDALNTLNELAAALGDDASFATTVTNSLATKQDVVANVSDTEIGYLDGVTSGIQTQLDAKIPLAQTVADKSTNYSILAADAGTLITNSAAVTITVDDVLSVGEQIDFLQMGADQITFAQGTVTNLYSKDGNLKTAAQYSPASIKCVSSGVYVLVGDLGA